MRLDAYYYGFEPTGVEAIDRVLSAVACAGKAYHHTEMWTEETTAYEPFFRGKTPTDWIQNAAADAATALEAQGRALAEAVEAFEQCEAYFDNRADADCEGDPAQFVPNREMVLLTAVRGAMAKIGGRHD